MNGRSDVLSTRLDAPNTLPHQSIGNYDSPRDPLHGPIKWNPDHRGQSMSTSTSTYTSTSTVPESPPSSQLSQPYRRVKSLPSDTYYLPPQDPLLELEVLHNSMVLTRFKSKILTGFNSDFPDLIQIKVFDGIRLRFPQLNLTQSF